jgi:hypothetical protein
MVTRAPGTPTFEILSSPMTAGDPTAPYGWRAVTIINLIPRSKLCQGYCIDSVQVFSRRRPSNVTRIGRIIIYLLQVDGYDILF